MVDHYFLRRFLEEAGYEDAEFRRPFAEHGAKLVELALNIKAFGESDPDIEDKHVAQYLTEILVIVGELGSKL